MEHFKTRLMDVATLAVAAAILFSAYSGYVLVNKVGNVFSGQCAVIQDAALDQAVKAAVAAKEKEDSRPADTP